MNIVISYVHPDEGHKSLIINGLPDLSYLKFFFDNYDDVKIDIIGY